VHTLGAVPVRAAQSAAVRGKHTTALHDQQRRAARVASQAASRGAPVQLHRRRAHAHASAHVEELSAQRSADLAACACAPSAACCLSCRVRARASRAERSRGRRGAHKSIAAHAPYSASVVAAITLFNIASVVACYHTSTFPRAAHTPSATPRRRAAATSPRGAMLPSLHIAPAALQPRRLCRPCTSAAAGRRGRRAQRPRASLPQFMRGFLPRRCAAELHTKKMPG
jgi:hypothetical protein